MASANATPDDFLSGQGVPVELKDVERELTRLWGPAAELAGGPELEHPNVTRIVLANLVVMARQDDLGRLQGVLETVAARYPSRTIVMVRSDDSQAGAGRAVRAEVSALCHLPAPGLPQVCSERIVLRAGPEAVDLLPGAVRPLLEADLPFVLWWADDPRRDEAVFRDLSHECSRLILDLPDPGAEPAALHLGLDPKVCPHSRDAAWFGVTRWRELLAQFFDPPCAPGTLGRIDSVRIEVASPPPRASGADPNPPRAAVWLAAWLAGQIGWWPEGRPQRAGGRLRAAFRGPTGPVSLEIQTQTDPGLDEPQIQTVLLTTRGAEHDTLTDFSVMSPDAPAPPPQPEPETGPEVFRLVRAVRGMSKVRIEADSRSHCALPRTVLAPELDAARRISAALESSRLDPPFQNALPHALWLLEG
jgi:glucose-6-phosphate dehydrogenase assembly protein OpcA